jgi:hypothetical protein
MNPQRIHTWSLSSGMMNGVQLSLLNDDFQEGARIFAQFSGGPSKDGTVIRLRGDGSVAVVELAELRWWLRRNPVVQVGLAWACVWEVGGREP